MFAAGAAAADDAAAVVAEATIRPAPCRTPLLESWASGDLAPSLSDPGTPYADIEAEEHPVEEAVSLRSESWHPAFDTWPVRAPAVFLSTGCPCADRRLPNSGQERAPRRALCVRVPTSARQAGVFLPGCVNYAIACETVSSTVRVWVRLSQYWVRISGQCKGRGCLLGNILIIKVLATKYETMNSLMRVTLLLQACHRLMWVTVGCNRSRLERLTTPKSIEFMRKPIAVRQSDRYPAETISLGHPWVQHHMN
eukprot:scaffold21_cov368-Prasinococcus_capsulatus_cf.AAC.14